jgi:hypothetical protein
MCALRSQALSFQAFHIDYVNSECQPGSMLLDAEHDENGTIVYQDVQVMAGQIGRIIFNLICFDCLVLDFWP